VSELNAIDSSPVEASAVGSAGAARDLVESDATSAALIVDPSSTTDRLLVASAEGASVASAIEEIISDADASQHRTVVVTDVVPLQKGDGHGLTGFYLVIGWIVGGYLVAALLGVSSGARPATTRRALFRLLALVPYAILSGLGGAIIVGPVLGALTGHLVGLWGLGVLLVLAAGAVTMAFQVLFGVIGIGITVLVFVILGNPSAGGAYQPALLPPFWRAIGEALPNGAGTDAVRRIVYFGARGIGGHLAVIALYIVGGIGVTVVGSLRHDRQGRPRRVDTVAGSDVRSDLSDTVSD
jgi:hypothetical protein